ncbi:MAG: hypothetical protein V1828_01730 [Candidatus Omnitrophota bacterium]
MRRKNNLKKKVVYLVVCFSLFFQQMGFAQMAGELNIAGHLSSMHASMAIDKFRPLHLRYFSYDLNSDNFKFLFDKGDFEKGLLPKGTVPEEKFREESQELLKYFLIGITLPDSKFWVNLRPDSESQIIEPELEQTDLGKVLLEADLQLKKDTAKYTSPETPEGRQYWNKLYKKAEELFGYENVTIPTLTRPWIVPGEIIVRETQDSSFIYKSTLKVMLEQDYLKSTENRVQSTEYNFKDERAKALNEYSTQLIRELIIPKLTKEVNTSKKYAALRQVFYSLILSRWFKARFAPLRRVQRIEYREQRNSYIDLIDTKDLTNLTSKTPWSKSEYFNQYKKSFNDGEYNIKEPVYTPTGQVIRSYFSGGIQVSSPATTFGGFGVEGIGDENLFRARNMISRTLQGTSLQAPEVTAGSPIIDTAKAISYLGGLITALHIKEKFNLDSIEYSKKKPGYGEVLKIDFGPAIEKVQAKKEEASKNGISFSNLEEFCKWVNAGQPNKIVKETVRELKIKEETKEAVINIDSMLKEINRLAQSSKSNQELLNKIFRIIYPKYLLNFNEVRGYLNFARERLSGPPLNLQENWLPYAKRVYEAFSRLMQEEQKQQGAAGRPSEARESRGNAAESDMPEGSPKKGTAGSPIIESELVEELKEYGFSSSFTYNLLKRLSRKDGWRKDGVPHIIQKFFTIGKVWFRSLSASEKGRYSQTPSYEINLYGRERIGSHEVLKITLDTTTVRSRKPIGILGKTEFEGEPVINVDAQSIYLGDLNYNNDAGKAIMDVLKEIEAGAAGPPMQDASSAMQAQDVVGGIDFRVMNIITQPLVASSSLSLKLPQGANLAAIDLDDEFHQIQGMLAAGIIPSGERIKEIMASSALKGEWEKRIPEIISCLVEVCRLEEDNVAETPLAIKEAMIIADSAIRPI